MADHRHGQVHWYSPDPRAILPLDDFKLPRSLRKRIRQQLYIITSDRACPEVIRLCAEPRDYESQTWINDQIISTYAALHQLGFVHSVEAWQPTDMLTRVEDNLPMCELNGQSCQLVGGLYGVAIGGAFCGESMFSKATDASKVCLAYLLHHLRQKRFTLLDTQLANHHMAQFGIIEIHREEYLSRLAEALSHEPDWHPFESASTDVISRLPDMPIPKQK